MQYSNKKERNKSIIHIEKKTHLQLSFNNLNLDDDDDDDLPIYYQYKIQVSRRTCPHLHFYQVIYLL